MLIDEYDNVVYELALEDLKVSLYNYLEWIYGMHTIKNVEKSYLSETLGREIDNNEKPMLYYECNGLRYAWITCDLCPLPSMN